MAKSKKTKKEVKKEERKNLIYGYIKLFLVLTVTLGSAVLFRNWYHTNKIYKMTIPVLQNVVREIKADELESYVLDNDKTIIYLCRVEDKKCRSFEKEFKKVIERDSLQEKITYINLSAAKKDFKEKLKNNYSIIVNEDPTLVVFENGEALASLVPAKIIDVEKFLESYGVKAENE